MYSLSVESSRDLLNFLIKIKIFVYHYGKISSGEEVACMYLLMILCFIYKQIQIFQSLIGKLEEMSGLLALA